MTAKKRHTFRKALLFLGLPLLVASALIFITPPTTASAQVDDKCTAISRKEGNNLDCVTLVVKLVDSSGKAVKPPLAATVHAQRVKALGGIPSDDFYLDMVGNDTSTYSSVGRIDQTDNSTPPCSVAPTPDTAKYKITITGQATGSYTNLNICGPESPKASVVNGTLTKTISITVSSSSAGTVNTLGGLKGIEQSTDNSGKTIACQNTGAVGITASDLTFDVKDSNGKVVQNLHPDDTGAYTTGYTLKPRTYSVYFGCVINGELKSQTITGIVVKAGVITDVGTKNSNPSSGTTADQVGGNACNISGALGWIECPVFTAMNALAIKLDGIIATLLEINTKVVFDQSGNYYKVWNNFRIIAVGLIVVAGLIMVFGQALGLEVMDAYTIRKVLPRLLIVAIGMTLSWPLLEFVVTFFNNMGNWVGDILTAPFGNVAQVSYQSIIGTIMGAGAAVAGTGALVVTAFALGSITVEGLMALVLTLILAMLVALLVLTVRNMIVIITILTAPIAIACYILPGTQKVWKIWKDALVTSLMMFPIVEGFLATGKILANVTFSGGSGVGKGSIAGVLGLLAYATPYFLLPMAFKMAGGLIGNFTGMVNDRTRGGFDRLRKKRQDASKHAKQAMKQGNRWNEDSILGRSKLGGIVRRGNTLGAHMGVGAGSLYGFGKVGQAKMGNAALTTMGDQAKVDSNFAAQINNERAMAAHAFGNDAGKLAQLKFFQKQATDSAGNKLTNADGSAMMVADDDAIQGAITQSRTIRMTRQSRSAAGDALAASGKVIQSRGEAEMLFDAEASDGNGNVNQSLRAATKGREQYTWRNKGRNDIGRNNDEESLREMNMSHVAAMKPVGISNLFGERERTNADGTVTRSSGVMNAISSTASKEQRQHYADLLFAAQYNPYTTAEQQNEIAKSISTLQGHSQYGEAAGAENLWSNAQQNYVRKMAPGGTTPGTVPGAGGAPGTAPP